MTHEREVRKETDFWGNEKEVVYENGEKIGEIKTEERGGFLGIGSEAVKVEYNTHGEEVGYTKSEERGGFLGIGAEEVQVRYDSDDKEVGYSRVEERGGFLGIGTHHVRVEYDNEGNEVGQSNSERRGDFLGIGGERVRVTRYNDERSPSANNVSGGGASSNDSVVVLGGLVLLGVLAALWFGSRSNNESLSETTPAGNTEQPLPSTNPAYSGATGVVNTPGDGFLALRSEPSSSQGSRLLKIPHATPLDIGECISNSKAENWCRTTYQGQTGWISGRYVIKEDKAHKNISTTVAMTLPRGNAERKAILDVIRAEYSRPVIFEVLHLKNSGNWTWATIRPKSADGKEGYEDQSVLLQKIGNEWQKVDGLEHGADCGEEHCPEIDVAALQRRHSNAPASIFE